MRCRTTACAWLGALALSTGIVSGQNHNPAYVNSVWWYRVLNNQRHPVTGAPYSPADAVPTEYFMGGRGVPAGTRIWRVIPSHVWRRAEPRQISGITYLIGNSAATGSVNRFAWSYTVALGRTLPRVGGGLDPDFNTTIVQLPPSMRPPTTTQFSRVTQTFAPVSATVNDASLWFEYFGGENDDVDANAVGRPSQTVAFSWSAGPMPLPMMGVDEPGRRYLTTSLRPSGELFVYALEEGPVCRYETSWGRENASLPNLWGYSLGSYYAPLSGRSAKYDVFGGVAHAGEWMASFLNVGQIYGGATPVGLHMVELDPFGPLFMLHGFYALDGEGAARNYPLFPSTPPGTLGQAFGIESVVLDPTSLTITGTTGAQWMIVDRP